MQIALIQSNMDQSSTLIVDSTRTTTAMPTKYSAIPNGIARDRTGLLAMHRGNRHANQQLANMAANPKLATNSRRVSIPQLHK